MAYLDGINTAPGLEIPGMTQTAYAGGYEYAWHALTDKAILPMALVGDWKAY